MRKHPEEIGLSKLFLDKNFIIHQVEENDVQIIYHAKSISYFARCPDCGTHSVSCHSTAPRTLQGVPLGFKKSIFKIRIHKYFCDNPDCDCRTFSEPLAFARPYQQRLNSLNGLILASAMMTSNEGASHILSLLGIDVSDSSIERLLGHIVIQDDPNVTAVGIDDVSTTKGQVYATVIYNLHTRDFLALLPGRDSESIKDWLKKHPKITLVARDGSAAYAKAVSDVLPEADQVSDKFHLVKNILDKISDAAKDVLPDSAYFKDGAIVSSKEAKVWTRRPNLKLPVLSRLHYDNTPPLDEDGNEIIFETRGRRVGSAQFNQWEQRRKAKYDLVLEIRSLYQTKIDEGMDEGKAGRAVAKEINKDLKFVKACVFQSEEEVEKIKTAPPRQKPKLEGYVNMIYKMLKDKISPNVVYNYVIAQGYSGEWSTLESFISIMAYNNFGMNVHQRYASRLVFPEGFQSIKRNSFLYYMATLEKDPESPMRAPYKKLLETYPEMALLEQEYLDFHRVLMGHEPEALDGVLEKYRDGRLSSFWKGIEKDIAAVKNAISYNITSGFVEGNNNKFKLIKRIGYGRTGLTNLEKKCWLCFQTDSEDFDLASFIA